MMSEEHGIDYIVMELLDGETLGSKLAKGALPVQQALRYGVEIAGALDRAHCEGITHRDLKPGNIMVTRSGAKLLDFGLAKTHAHAAAAVGTTATMALTDENMLLGTLQYMAPEQLEGKQADARSDIFAFGCVLYEMLTGKQAFAGKSPASVIAAILERQAPALDHNEPSISPALQRVVSKCLAKDPDSRWQTARDLGDELRWISETGPAVPQRTTHPVARGRTWLWMLAAIAAGAATTAAVAYFRGGREPALVMRFTVSPP